MKLCEYFLYSQRDRFASSVRIYDERSKGQQVKSDKKIYFFVVFKKIAFPQI